MARHARLIGLLGAILAISALAPVAGALASPASTAGETAPVPSAAGMCPLRANTEITAISVVVPAVIDVLANDDTCAATASRPLTITTVTQGSYGAVTHDGRTVVYNPTACRIGDADGYDTFSYTITDGVTTKTGTAIVRFARPSGTPVSDVPTAGFVSGSTLGSTIPLKVSWCGATASGSSIKSYRVEQSTNGGSTFPSVITSATTGTSSTRNASLNTNYVWRVRTTDAKSRVSAYAQSLTSRVARSQDNGGKITYSSGWKTASSSKYSGGKEHYVAKKGATATLTVSNVRQFAIVASRGSGRGSFYVYVDGKRVTTSSISQRSSKASWKRVLYVGTIPGSTAASHTIQVRTTSKSRVDLDAILTLSGKQTPSVAFTNPAPVGATYGDTPYAADATTTSGLPLTLSVKPASWTVCSLAGTTVTFHGTGTCAVDATIAADPAWSPVTATRSFTVARAPLTVSGISAQNRAYDRTTVAPLRVVNPAIASGVRPGDGSAVALDASGATGTFASANAGAGKAVTVTGLVLTGTKASLYAITPPALTADITKATQTITFDPAVAPAAIKGGATYTVHATSNSGLAVTLSINASSAGVCTLAGHVVSFPGSGNCRIDAAQAGDGNWSPVTKPQSFSVASTGSTIQSITFAPIADATYGDGPIDLSGVVASSGLPVTLVATTPAVCTIAGSTAVIIGAGTCSIDADQAGNPTYKAAPKVTQAFQVAPVTLAVTGVTANDKAYDGSRAASLDVGSAALVGVLPGDSVTLVTTSAAGTFADKDASGSAKLVAVSGLALGGADKDSYALVQPTTTATIGKATLTVTANSHVITYGDAEPAPTFAYSSFALGETAAVLDTAPACSIGGVSRDVSGSPYPITCAGGADGNYAFAYVAGTLTVNAKTVSLSFTAADKPYDGTTDATITSCTPAVIEAGDTVTCDFGPATATFDTPAIGTGKTVTGTGFALAGPDAGNYTIGAIGTATASITIAPQVIVFTSSAPNPATAAGATYLVSATGGGSGNPVVFTSGTPSVCTVSTATVTFLISGTCTIRANQAGTAGYAAAAQVTQDITVAKQAQTITFNALADRTYGNSPFGVSASATSGLAVTFSSRTAPVCTVSVATVTLLKPGTCTIRASQGGNGTWAVAADVDESFSVDKATITVTPDPQSMAYGAGQPTYTFAYGTFIGGDGAGGIDTPPTCGVTPAPTDAGPYTITCSGGLDDKYLFSFLTGTLTVTKAGQTITFDGSAPAGAVVGGSAVQTATATSGLAAVITVHGTSTGGACSLTGSTVNFDGAGTCVLAANQPGDGNWNAAPQVLRSFAITLASQTITFTDPANTPYGDPVSLSATATSGLTVAFATQTPAVCTVAGVTATTLTTGTCTVRATQPGDTTYAPATPQDQSFTVGARPITVTAVTASKTADGTTTASGTPTLTAGSIAAGDTGAFTQSFATASAGSGKTIIPTGTVHRGGPNVTAYYAITWGNDTTGTITPAALASIVVSPPTGQVAAGASQAYTAEAFDGFGNSRGDVTGSTVFSITPDGSCTGASCSATVTGAHVVTGTHLAKTDTAALTVQAAAATTLEITTPTAQIAGVPFSVTVTAKDAYGNTATGYTGSVTFTSTDGTAQLPTPYTFVGGDNGSRGFSATLKEAGTQTITADDGTLSVTTDPITVNPAAASLTTSTITADDTTLAGNGSATVVTVALRDAFGNPLTASGGTVTLNLSGPGSLGAVTNNGNGTYSATYTSPIGTGTATITGALDGQPLANDETITVTP